MCFAFFRDKIVWLKSLYEFKRYNINFFLSNIESVFFHAVHVNPKIHNANFSFRVAKFSMTDELL